ncbi:cell division cycle protein 23 [Cryptosporidium felis]|nr:cell division cycle protein 23 [Cryptosporidium felis]
MSQTQRAKTTMEILRACFRFSFLGLRSNERWLSELLGQNEEEETIADGLGEEVLRGLTVRQTLLVLRARSYFESQEYTRAFGVLDGDAALRKSMTAMFMKNYFLLLSLERQDAKTDRLEDMVVPPSEAGVISIKHSMMEAEILDFLNGFGSEQKMVEEGAELAGLLEWLVSALLFRQNRFSEALEFQITSLRKEPFNWSCWLDLVRNLASNGPGLPFASKASVSATEQSLVHGEPLPGNSQRKVGLQPLKRVQNSNLSRGLRDSCFPDFVESLGLKETLCGRLAFAFYLETLGKWKEALAEYETALAEVPTSPYVQTQIARCKRELGDSAAAIQIHQVVLKLDKYFLGNAIELASLLSESKNIRELTLLSKRCVELSEYSVETCVVLGMYHWLANDKHKALRFYKRAILLDAKSSFVWVLCGYALHELGNTRGSLFAYRTALNLDSTNVQAIFGISQIFSKLNLHPYSIKLFEKALNQSPSDAFLWYNLGISFEKTGNLQEASRSFYRALSCESAKNSNSDAEIKYMGKLLQLESDQWNQTGSLYWARKIVVKALELGFLEKADHQDPVPSPPASDENEFFSNWHRLRWSVRMVPQKLPLDLIAALECLLQLLSSPPDENKQPQSELLLENIRELLNVPDSFQPPRNL